MNPILVFPNPPPQLVVRALEMAGYAWQAVSDAAAAAVVGRSGGAVISAEDGVETALAVCRTLRRQAVPICPILLLVSADQLCGLDRSERVFDDFCVTPVEDRELAARLRWQPCSEADRTTVRVGDIVVELEIHRAAVAGRQFTMTKKEHHLLRYLVTHPGKTFSRRQLLADVWGHELAFGCERTVDVHVRRLRSKLGPDHARLIQTVRSVGYRFAPSTDAAGNHD